MAREEHPNKFLARFSIDWATNNPNGGNPVKSAPETKTQRKVTKYVSTAALCVFLLGVILSLVIEAAGNTANVIMIVSGITLFICGWYRLGIHGYVHNVRRFIEAISLLEGLIGAPIEKWDPEMDVKKTGRKHLEAEAGKLKLAEI